MEAQLPIDPTDTTLVGGIGACLASTEGNERSVPSLPHWYYTSQETWSAPPASIGQGCGSMEYQLCSVMSVFKLWAGEVQFYSWYLAWEGEYYKDCFQLFSHTLPDQLSWSDFFGAFRFFFWGGGLCCWWFWVGNFCNTHLGYMGDNNKTQESHCLGVSQIVKSVGHLPSSFCLSWFCCACVIWYQGFLAKRWTWE